MAQVQGSREEILVSAYNEGYQYFEEYKNTTKEYYDSLKKKYEDEKISHADFRLFTNRLASCFRSRLL